MLRLAQLSANKYKFGVNGVTTNVIETVVDNQTDINIVNTPTNALINIINEQKEKENRVDIWKNSVFKSLPNLQSNNIGNVGELFLGKI